MNRLHAHSRQPHAASVTAYQAQAMLLIPLWQASRLSRRQPCEGPTGYVLPCRPKPLAWHCVTYTARESSPWHRWV